MWRSWLRSLIGGGKVVLNEEESVVTLGLNKQGPLSPALLMASLKSSYGKVPSSMATRRRSVQRSLVALLVLILHQSVVPRSRAVDCVCLNNVRV